MNGQRFFSIRAFLSHCRIPIFVGLALAAGPVSLAHGQFWKQVQKKAQQIAPAPVPLPSVDLPIPKPVQDLGGAIAKKGKQAAGVVADVGKKAAHTVVNVAKDPSKP